MGLLARLLLGVPRAPGEIDDLSVDLARPAVAGLGRGATATDLEAALGPPEDYFARGRGSLVYPRLGIRVGLDAARTLDTFEVFLDPGFAWGLPPGSEAFAGSFRPWGHAPSEQELVALLGPARREVDEDEITLEWPDREDRYVGADLSLDGHLRAVYASFEGP